MNKLPTNKEGHARKAKSCSGLRGRQFIRSVLLVLALGLAAWPIWNWVAVPLLVLPSLGYWQMTAIVALVGVITRVFEAADRRRCQRRKDRPGIRPDWPGCRHPLKGHQG